MFSFLNSAWTHTWHATSHGCGSTASAAAARQQHGLPDAALHHRHCGLLRLYDYEGAFQLKYKLIYD